MTNLPTPEPCAEWSGRSRHLSINLTEVRPDSGRQGDSLCTLDGDPRAVWDQAGIGEVIPAFAVPDIAALPPCQPCEEAAAKLIGGAR